MNMTKHVITGNTVQVTGCVNCVYIIYIFSDGNGGESLFESQN